MQITHQVADIEMRDGTILRADVYRPDDNEQYPVLLRRTPYRKEGWAGFARRLAENGYTVVVQDLRGRGASDGEFIWSFADEAQDREAQDGFDTVAWCGVHPNSNGSVGTWGHSYDGWSQLRTAATQPPALKTMHIAGITARYLDMTRGILDVGRRMEWCYTLGTDLAGRASATDSVPVDRDHTLTDRWANFERGKWIWFVPFGDLPEHALTGASKFFQDYIRRVNVEVWNFDQVLDRVEVPTAFLTGWWDRFSDCERLYSDLLTSSKPELAAQHRLLMGPWSHNPDTFVADIGDLNTGGDGGIDYVGELLAWFDTQLKGAPETPGVVRYFNVGSNEWRTSDVWPPADKVERTWFVHSEGNATDLTGGDGVLDTTAPAAEPSDEYVYDPRDPVMSLMLGDSHHAPRDQSANDTRPDVVHYLSAPLTEPLEVSGTPRVTLWASSDAPDTDWVARLIDVDENGTAINVVSGILRARYRNSYTEPELLTPDQPTEFTVTMSVTSYTLLPGHRMRLDITSSDFPNFDRNHNTGADFATDGELRPARQRILHDSNHPTQLHLPVVEN